MRFAVDTGGTFTDLIVEDLNGEIRLYKASTTPGDPTQGVLDALALAAADHKLSPADFLGQGESFIFGTTHAINAIVTGRTARTAFLTTEGHPDVLVLREGGRTQPFDFTVPYTEPYIPRALTFEVKERVRYDGQVVTPLDEAAVRDLIGKLRALEVEAVAVCLLWSIVNPEHEIRLGQLLAKHLPDVAVTLSHELNPVMREYGRASSTCIDASIKPLMTRFLGELTTRLKLAGFGGRLLVLTSQGGMVDASEMVKKPILAINSGPSMAPIAGNHYAQQDGETGSVIVADTGGTTYDVSLVRGGRIPLTRNSWIGEPYRGHLTGFPSVDVRSIGAGGGSIAWVDDGGVLHMGPQSAGARPGPACYGKGGTHATFTDAAVVLGYIDHRYFLGGAMQLKPELSYEAIQRNVALPLGVSVQQAAAAMVDVLTENMVQAIADITVKQGIDPAASVLIGGGGAAGLNSVFIARRLGCPSLLIPETGAALSAAGAIMSDLASEYHATHFATSDHFDEEGVNAVLAKLEAKCSDFTHGPGRDAVQTHIEFVVEARYAHQVWEIEVPLSGGKIKGASGLSELIEAFHASHEAIFAFRDELSVVEFVSWTARVRCSLRSDSAMRLRRDGSARPSSAERSVYLQGVGQCMVAVHAIDAIEPGARLPGPAILESPFTTIVVDADSFFSRTAAGNVVITVRNSTTAERDHHVA